MKFYEADIMNNKNCCTRITDKKKAQKIEALYNIPGVMKKKRQRKELQKPIAPTWLSLEKEDKFTE